MLLVLQIAQYEAVALEVEKMLLVLFWTVFRIMQPGRTITRNSQKNLALQNLHPIE